MTPTASWAKMNRRQLLTGAAAVAVAPMVPAGAVAVGAVDVPMTAAEVAASQAAWVEKVLAHWQREFERHCLEFDTVGSSVVSGTGASRVVEFETSGRA